MIRLMRVSGDSLAPDYKEGDFVLIVKIPFFLSLIRPEDVVVFRHADHGILIKRVEWIDRSLDHLFVIGNRPGSVDSRKFGPISQQDLIGKVIWHIRSGANS